MRELIGLTNRSADLRKSAETDLFSHEPPSLVQSSPLQQTIQRSLRLSFQQDNAVNVSQSLNPLRQSRVQENRSLYYAQFSGLQVSFITWYSLISLVNILSVYWAFWDDCFRGVNRVSSESL